MNNDIKILTSVITFLIVLFSGCSGNRYPDILIAADSISDTNPQRTLSMLDSISAQMSNADEAVKSYYELLRIKASDKAYIPHKSDITILRLVDYYENGGDKSLLPVVYYYAGRVNSDLNNAPEALGYFHKAEEAIKKSKSENLKLLGLIYGQIGTVLDYQEFFNEALEAYFKEKEIKTLTSDTLGLVYSLRDISCSYWYSERLDSALYYLNCAEKLAVKLNDKYVLANIYEQLASLNIHVGNTDAASEYLKKAAPYADIRNMSSTLSIYARLYEKTGQRDSAYSCYKKLLHCGNVYGKQRAYGGLTKYYLDRGKTDETKKSLNCYMEIVDSIRKITVSNAVATSLSIYKHGLHEKKNYELKLAVRKSKEHNLYILLISTVVILVSLSLLLWYRHKNKLLELEKAKAEIAEKNRVMEEQMLRENKDLQVKSSDIYVIIKKRIADYHKTQETLTEEEWDNLRITLNRVYIDFESKVHNLISEISRQEYRVSMLIKIGIRPTDIGLLTNHSRAAINSTRSRLYEKAYGTKGSPADWDNIIRSL